MAKKKSRSKSSKKLELFNRSQEINKLLEKGIIEGEALMSSAVDRPEDDAHLLDLLESTSSTGNVAVSRSSRKAGGSSAKKKTKPSKSKKAAKKGKKR